MGKYERIAIELLQSAFGDRFVWDDTRIFSFGPDAGTGEVDGTIDGKIAVEIGVGSPKQIRASVLDLALNPYPGKLLVLVDTPGHSTKRPVGQAKAILERLGVRGVVYRVAGSRDVSAMSVEVELIVANHLVGPSVEYFCPNADVRTPCGLRIEHRTSPRTGVSNSQVGMCIE